MMLFVLLVLIGPGAAAQERSTWPIEGTAAGPLAIGLPIDTIRDALAEGYELSDRVLIFPGLEGFAVSMDDTIHAFVATDDDDVVRLLILLDARFRTAAGIGPWSTVADAEAAYGAASFEWFPDGRGSEVVEFVDQPDFLHFQTSDIGGPRAGIYADDALETDEYQDDAIITTVWIDCRSRTCPATGIEDVAEPDDMGEPLFPDADEEPGGTLAETGLGRGEPLAALGFTLVGLGCTALAVRRSS